MVTDSIESIPIFARLLHLLGGCDEWAVTSQLNVDPNIPKLAQPFWIEARRDDVEIHCNDNKIECYTYKA